MTSAGKQAILQPVLYKAPASLSLRVVLELSKPRIATMVAISAGAGYYAGQVPSSGIGSLAALLAGTGLLASGASVMNQVLERDTDARMFRTRCRPIPSGRISSSAATSLGAVISTAGLGCMLFGTNLAATVAAGLAWILYVAVYTPFKSRTTQATTVGAVPGALPPLAGYLAAHGTLGLPGVLLTLLLFLWQFPHFYSIGWLHREDYRRAKIHVLSGGDSEGRRTAFRSVSIALILATISTGALIRLHHGAGAAAVLAASLAFLVMTTRFARTPSDATARVVLIASVIYLPALLGITAACLR